MSNFNNSLIKTLIVPAIGAFLTLAPAQSQSLYGLDSQGGLANPLVVELTGPPVGGYPSGPFGIPAWAAFPGFCPGPTPFASGFPGLDGDIAVDKINDEIWVAGPNEIGLYDTNGIMLNGFFNPMVGPIKAMGMDSAGGGLWLSDGNAYALYLPQPACAAPVLLLGPYPNPHTAPMTDISWDPNTLSLWACFADGLVANFNSGAAIGCSFDGLATGLLAPLTGLAVDTSTPGFVHGQQVIAITDGVLIARFDAGISCATGLGALTAPDFPFPQSQFVVAGGQLSGLAYSAHHVNYGPGSGLGIRFVGHSVPALASSAIELFAAAPGNAYLLLDFAPLAPSAVLFGQPLNVTVGPTTTIIGPISHGGNFYLPATIPASVPIGVELYMQWFNKKTTGGWESSSGMVITTALP